MARVGSHGEGVPDKHVTRIRCDAKDCEEELIYIDISGDSDGTQGRGETGPSRNCRVAAPYIVETSDERLTKIMAGNGCCGDWTASCKGSQGAPFITLGCNPDTTRRLLRREGSQLLSSNTNGCLCGWTAVSCATGYPPHAVVQSGTYPPRGRCSMGSPRGAGSRSALSERTDREKMYTLQPQEPSMTHIDGGYGGTVCHDLGVATATSNEQLIRSADDRCLGASAAVLGDGDAGEKTGRRRRDAS